MTFPTIAALVCKKLVQMVARWIVFAGLSRHPVRHSEDGQFHSVHTPNAPITDDRRLGGLWIIDRGRFGGCFGGPRWQPGCAKVTLPSSAAYAGLRGR